jgi:hypothetical protein
LQACPGAAAFAQRRRAERMAMVAGPLARSASRPALRDALVELAARDQALRHAAIAAGRESPSATDAAALSELTKRAALLLAGEFPTLAEVGSDGVNAAWILVQHSARDAPDFQHQMLAQIEGAPERFGFRNGEPALLADKALVAQGRPQRYGTQFERRGNRYVPLPIQAAEDVDRRRASVGLMPLSDYDCFLNVFLEK